MTADLAPPWILLVEGGKPVAILPAGRSGKVLNVEGWPLEKASALIAMANQESESFNARMTQASERLLELAAKADEEEPRTAQITCPVCLSEYESNEVEYDGDERNIDCLECGETFYVIVKVVRSYRCATELPEQK